MAPRDAAPVLDPGRSWTKTAQLFAYARDDRPWQGADSPAVVFVYAHDRKAERPVEHLHSFADTLWVDGYAGYRALADKGEVKLTFCWAHVRRKFYELAAAGRAPIALEALERIAALYRIETEIRARSAEVRRLVRQDLTRPLLDALEAFLRQKLVLMSQKTKLAEVIRYALSRWEGPCHFLDDGRIELDNNSVERSIRPLALTRKNALFARSDAGARHWTVVASLVETCKLNDVDPQAYLADVITRIVQGHPNRNIGDLMPRRFESAEIALAAVA